MEIVSQAYNSIRSMLKNVKLTQIHNYLTDIIDPQHTSKFEFYEIITSDNKISALINLEQSGYFNENDVLPDEPQIATDTGNNSQSPEARAEFRNKENIVILKSILDMPKPKLAGNNIEATFIFIADPQPSRENRNDNNVVVQKLSKLNNVLNNINFMQWPVQFSNLSRGTNFNINSGIFIGGDLCQCGGDINYNEQHRRYFQPYSYDGGWELEIIRHLYQKNYVSRDMTFSSKTVSTIYDAYFGLGNHDVQSDYHPLLPWNGFWAITNPKDYWRWQMWNFICQMHSGVHYRYGSGLSLPAVPVTQIDHDGKGGIDWRKNSLNYFINLGPVDVYNLHVYGGDQDFDHKDGMQWLLDRLNERGKLRPVIIVQHYSFDVTRQSFPKFTPNWADENRNYLTKMLSPFNVIACLTGHLHNQQAPSNFPIPINTKIPGRTFDGFRPGAAQEGRFAIVKVTDASFEIIEGTVDDNENLIWNQCYSKALVNHSELPLYRAYNAQVSDHFYTMSLYEIDHAQGYIQETTPCNAYTNPNLSPENLIPLYRCYNSEKYDHFYTTDEVEYNNSCNNGYSKEGICCYVYPFFGEDVKGLNQLYRLFNKSLWDHFYTTNELEKNNAMNNGYSYEMTQCLVPEYFR